MTYSIPRVRYTLAMISWQDQLQTAQKHLCKADPLLKELIARYGDCSITPHTDYYHELVDAIISQQLSVKAGATIFSRFLGLFDGKMPTPEQIIAIDTEKIRGVGCSYSKAAYIKDLAQHITDGRLDLAHVTTLPNDTVIEQLTAVKGIGEWSAHMFMIFSLGRLDILPTGDLGVRKAMMRLYALPEMPKPIEMTAVAEANHWAPYQSIASWYLWKSLDNVPA